MRNDATLSAFAANNAVTCASAGQTLPVYCGACSGTGGTTEQAARRQVALNSNTGSAGPLPILSTTLSDPLNVVSTSIDTRGMVKTNNLLIFTGIIALPLGVVVTLNFQIQRTGRDGASAHVGATYTFSTTATVLEAEAFSFQFFDSDVAAGTYTYSVQLSSNTILSVTPGVTVTGTLSVLAVADDIGDRR